MGRRCRNNLIYIVGNGSKRECNFSIVTISICYSAHSGVSQLLRKDSTNQYVRTPGFHQNRRHRFVQNRPGNYLQGARQVESRGQHSPQ